MTAEVSQTHTNSLMGLKQLLVVELDKIYQGFFLSGNCQLWQLVRSQDFFCNKPSLKVLKASWNPLVSLQLALRRSLLEALKKPRKNKCEYRRRFGTSNRKGYERMNGPESLRRLVLFLMNFFVYFSVELKPQGRHNVGVDFWLFHTSFVAAKESTLQDDQNRPICISLSAMGAGIADARRRSAAASDQGIAECRGSG